MTGFLIGALVGGTAAILLSQEELRDRVAGKARDAGSFAMGATGDLRGRVSDVTSQWQSGVSELYERGRRVVESARANVDAAVNEGKSTADQTRDDLQRQAEET
ncbi:MAG: YtxH domain-containing protein [Candidatus Eremiobacteraeota bacterium]|nr:YtxH domain-containing protein [Candidatus Eremiobacteraeota bacterium]MBV9263543.1 YtxH domain-containing protein [Candidatus Eremiobacteraeota bacterium]